jgi:predicted PurR-regulated permease PerM
VGSPGDRAVNDSRITPGALYRMVLLAFGLVVAGLVFRQLISLVLAVMIVVIIALPLSSFATQLQRIGVPRGVGAVLALLIGLGVIGGLIALTVPVFSQQINQFTKSLPGITDELRHRLGALTGTSPTKIGTQIQHFVDGYTQHPTKLLGPLESIGASVAAGLAAVIVVLLTALYTAIHPQPLQHGLVRMFPPPRRRHAEHVLDRLRLAYIGWLRGLAIGMLVLGGITYAGLRLAGLPFAAFFAMFTAVAMIVPYFGALISSVPPILYALTFSPGKAIVVAIIYLIAHQIEGNLIEPLVVARAVKLHPAVVAVGVVAVDQLLGFVGLIVAVPIIATVKILIEELWVEPLERRAHARMVDPDPPETPAGPPPEIIVAHGRGRSSPPD